MTMEEDAMSTATMTSVTEDVSLDETDTSTNEAEMSSQITLSDALEQEVSSVIHTPLFQIPVDHSMEADIIDVNMDRGNEQDKIITAPEEHTSILHTPFMRPSSHPMQSAPNCSSHHQPFQSRIQFSDQLSTSGGWYEHECFNRYWHHYQFVSMWCQKHIEVYRTIVEQNKVIDQQAELARQANASQSEHVFKKPVTIKTIRNRRARRRTKAAKRRSRMAIRNAELAGRCSSLSTLSEDTQKVGSGSETTVSGKDEDMEITSEMLDFFAHTHKHRQERDALKRKRKVGRMKKHRNIEEGSEQDRTEAPPVERPGSKRTSEMRLLYGSEQP